MNSSSLSVLSGQKKWAAAVASALLIGGLNVLGGHAAAAAAPGGVADAAEAQTEAAASAVAEKYGHPVRIGALTDEFNETSANPDGTLTLRASAEPKRVRKDGKLVPLDTSLVVNADGSLSPRAALSDLRLSGGGDGALLTLGSQGRGITLTSPWKLAKPAVQGSVATYPDVLAGVDLQVTATAGGYQQVLVVKNAAAARNPQLSRVAWGVSGVGASVRERGGNVEVVDGADRVLFASDTPAMWDSPSSKALPKTRALRGDDAITVSDVDPDGKRWHARSSMPVSVSAGKLVLQPDLAMLSSADTNYPVYIDPSLSPATVTDWTMVNSGAPNTAEYNYNSRDYYRVGMEYNTSNKWRTHFGFNISSMAGADSTIYSATLDVVAYHTNLCAGSDVDLWTSQAISNYKTYTWTNDSDNDLIAKVDTQHFSANKGSCPKANDPGSFGGTLVTQLNNYAHAGTSPITLALRGNTESNDSDWTKFVPGSTVLSVTYDHKPKLATTLGISKTTTCPDTLIVAGASIAATTPTLCAKPQDQDGGTARVEFEVWDTTHTTRVAYSNGSVTNRTVNQSAPWTVTPALGQGAFDWRVQSCDAHLCGDWSSWWNFTVDTIAPAVAAAAPVSGGAATYSTTTWAGGVNIGGNFNVTTSADATDVELELNGVSLGWKAAPGGTWTGTVTPPVDGPNTLRARSKDAAGNTAGWSAGTTFLVTTAVDKSWRWELNNSLASIDTVGSTVTNPGARPVSGFTPSYVASPGSQAVTFSGTQALVTGGAVVDISKSFTVSARVKLGTTTPAGPMTIASQDGPSGSGFKLQYRSDVSVDGSDAAWCFVMFAADGAAESASTRACAPAIPSTSDWNNIAGVYDAGGHTLQLWVNDDTGVMVMWEPPTTGFTSGWLANGAFAIGRGRLAGAAAEYFTGSIDRVGLFARPLTATEINTDKGTV